MTISCNTGLPLEQSKNITEAEGVEFVVTEFDDGELDCVITEDGATGYDAEYDDGTTTSATSCEYLDVTHGDELTCEITNAPSPVDVVIEKNWVFEGSNDPQGIDQRYDLTLWCDAEIVDGYNIFDPNQEAPAENGPGCGLIIVKQESGQLIGPIHNWCKTFYGEGPDGFNAQVIPEYPDSHCFVEERVYDDAVEVDNGCQNLVVSAGQGASCTITNTVFFEGIPTLSEYGMAILVLLMLGVGLVGFRRFA
ncbi:IPTL-CTERM sorting domain-containing protein [Elongatibacter sediminis]|uniref:IPTL-CTERM sorting domain-containing protein n=1 Tax=Elongatibacter sediminis TaxID=3119006 RepID=A0AAW9R6S3_9GAMM